MCVRILAARCARALRGFPPSETRGRRESRVRAAPVVSCAIVIGKNAHEHTGSAEAVRPSLRNGFTAYNVISSVTGFFATVAPGKLDTSVGVSGPHDFAVLIGALVSRAAASIASRSNVHDDREAPL